jgi:hypothetical protein
MKQKEEIRLYTLLLEEKRLFVESEILVFEKRDAIISKLKYDLKNQL